MQMKTVSQGDVIRGHFEGQEPIFVTYGDSGVEVKYKGVNTSNGKSMFEVNSKIVETLAAVKLEVVSHLQKPWMAWGG